jgi:uncharacterized protein YbaR (Trm112 family)
MTVQLDPMILEILACPQCHSNVSIDYQTNEVVCIGLACGLAYPIRNDIPVMLVEEARPTRGSVTGPLAAPSLSVTPGVTPAASAVTSPASPASAATPAGPASPAVPDATA